MLRTILLVAVFAGFVDAAAVPPGLVREIAVPEAAEVLALSRDNERLAAFFRRSKEFVIYETVFGRELRRFGTHGHHYPQSMVFAANHASVIVGFGDGAVVLFDSSGQEVPLFTAPNHSGSVDSLALSADGTRLLSAGNFGVARLWDVQSGKVLHEWIVHRQGHPIALAMSPDMTLGAAQWDDKLTLWNLRSLKELTAPGGIQFQVPNSIYGISGVGLSHQGELLTTHDRSVLVYATATGALREQHRFPSTVLREPAFSGDASRLMTADHNSRGLRWSDPTAAYCPTLVSLGDSPYALQFQKHVGILSAVTLSYDGTLAASAGANDRAIKLWRLPPQ